MPVVAYWPLDDPAGSRRAVSGIGGSSLTSRVFVGVGITPAAEFTPFAWQGGTLHQWLPPCLRAESGGDLQGGKLDGGSMARAGVAGEWALDFLYAASSPPGTDVDFPVVSSYSLRQTDGIRWDLSFSPDAGHPLGPGTASVSAFDADGVLLGGNGSISTGTLHDGSVKYIRLIVVDGGGGQGNWLLRVDGTIIGSGIIPMGGPLQAPQRYEMFWSQDALNDNTQPFHVGQVIVWDNAPASVFNVEEIILGHQGETPLERIRRVCEEDSVPFTGFGSLAIHEHATAMGPQRTDTFLGILREAERTSAGGVLYELAGGLAYATVEQRYNRTPGLALNAAGGDLAEPPEPTDDDLMLVNQVTVTKAITGEVARVEDADSIAESGVQPVDVDVNTSGELQLAPIAAWLLGVGLGTRDEYRWPELPLQLLLTPDLIPAWLQFRLGGRVTVDDMADQLPGVPVDVLAEGWSESLHHVEADEVFWQVTLNTAPARPFTVGQYGEVGTTPDPDAPQRYSPEDSRVLATFVTGTDTALSVSADSSGGNDQWTQDPATLPFDIELLGARLRVTGVGPVVSFAQTLTVQAAPINGVAKTIPTTTPVQLWTPARYAL